MGCSSSQTAPAWVLPVGCSPSGTGCSSVGPSRGHKPSQQVCSGMGSSLHRSIVPGRSLLQRGLPTGSQLPSDIPLLCRGVPSTGCRWISAPLWASMDCRGTTCLTMVFITSCKGRLSAPVSQEPPPPPSSLTLVSAELFFSHHLTPLSRLPFYRSIFPLLKYVITAAQPPSLIGLALASDGSILEPAGTDFIRHRGSFSQLLTEATPIAPHYQNFATQTHNTGENCFYCSSLVGRSVEPLESVLFWCSYWRDLYQLPFERLEWRVPSFCVVYVNLE